jgi:hypothetical protein
MPRNLGKELTIFRIMLVSTFWIPHHLGCEVPCRCEQHHGWHGITNGLRAKFLAEPGPGPALKVSRLVYFLNFESEADAPENTLHYNTCKPRPGRAGDACSCHGHGIMMSVTVSVSPSLRRRDSEWQAQVSHCQWFTYLDSESIQRICRHILELPGNIIIAGPGTVTGTAARLTWNLNLKTWLVEVNSDQPGRGSQSSRA